MSEPTTTPTVTQQEDAIRALEMEARQPIAKLGAELRRALADNRTLAREAEDLREALAESEARLVAAGVSNAELRRQLATARGDLISVEGMRLVAIEDGAVREAWHDGLARVLPAAPPAPAAAQATAREGHDRSMLIPDHFGGGAPRRWLEDNNPGVIGPLAPHHAAPPAPAADPASVDSVRLAEAVRRVRLCRRVNAYRGGVVRPEEQCSGVPTADLDVIFAALDRLAAAELALAEERARLDAVAAGRWQIVSEEWVPSGTGNWLILADDDDSTVLARGPRCDHSADALRATIDAARGAAGGPEVG